VTPIEIDVGARLVHRGAKPIRLPPKAFDLLLLLVGEQPNAVPHARLQAALWPGLHVSETSLPVLVTQLRKALAAGDGADVIRTVHTVGYAFVGSAVIVGDKGAPAPGVRLLWRRKAIEVPQGVSVVGRDRGCAICMDADSVSRRHARLHISGASVTIEDLGSKNGTWIDGKRIEGCVSLTDGTRFQIGSEPVRLELSFDARSTKTLLHPESE
jgi:DNA-binding winged helix-turn-helix (wHTH) protein